MTSRPWREPEPLDTNWQSPFGDIPPLIARLLWRRGLRQPADVDRFLQPDFTRDVHQPAQYLGMDRAVDRILTAIKKKERVTVYGDYDADGICATAIVVEMIQALGGEVNWYLPERLAEGYGLNTEAITDIAKQGTTLIVTVDCGTSNVAEVAHAKSLGLDVIILDHHQAPPQLPEAVAIINAYIPGQTYPFQGHSSGGVAFKLATALLEATNRGQTLKHPVPAGWEKWLLDLVAISTVADMMPLLGENRVLVAYGLKVLRRTRRPGLRALFTQMGTDPEQATEQTIAFQIAPRLNAAGRLQYAGTALRLLLTTDKDEAQALAAELQQVNARRQKLTELAVNEALEQIEQQGEQPAYVAFAPHWSPGIVGLIAGRLVERFWRPVVVMTENGQLVVGSGRSVPGFDITAHLRSGQEHFLRFGGHAGACGFTLITAEQRPVFADWFRESMPRQVIDKPTAKPVVIDTQAELDELTATAIDLLEKIGPYGMRNERPKLLLKGIRVVSFGTMGAERQHLRLVGQQGSQSMKFVGFRLGNEAASMAPGQRLDAVVEASWNDWNGQREVQLKIIDIRPS